MPLPIIALLSSLAPMAIRAAGAVIGGGTEKAATVIADVIEGSGGNEAAVERAINNLPPELQTKLAELANEAQRIDNERRARELQHDETMHAETQTTARVEASSNDPYVRRTRPGLARKSFYLGGFYIIAFEALEAFSYGDGADILLAGSLLSPALTYIGVRTADKLWGTQHSIGPLLKK